MKKFYAALLLAVALATGCATAGPREVATYDANGEPVLTKRLDAHPALDYRTHFVRAAYSHPGVVHYPEPAGQTAIIQEFGRPDWVRTFTSLAGEPVQEWLYTDLGTMYQFIGGTMVYKGGIGDMERVLLRRGYPDYAIMQLSDPDMNVANFIYTPRFGVALDDYHFINGQMLQFKEGR